VERDRELRQIIAEPVRPSDVILCAPFQAHAPHASPIKGHLDVRGRIACAFHHYPSHHLEGADQVDELMESLPKASMGSRRSVVTMA
jgi:hypothetical protein